MKTLSNMLSPIATLTWTCSALDPHPIDYLSQLSEAQRTERAVIFFLGLEDAPADAFKALDYGTELEFVIMVIAVSCVKLLSAHNSTQHTSRKHKV
jgi:hypothetical protein